MTSIGYPDRPAKAPSVPLRSIVIPTEHGGWGIVLEPALAALLGAPSAAGLLIALAALATFLIRQPAKMVTGDLVVRRRSFPRTSKAFATTVVLGVAAVAMLGLAWRLRGVAPLLPLLAAAPLAAIQILYDARNRSRNLFPEIAGATAMGASAAMILIAAGASPVAACALWLVVVLRTTGAIVYIRTRLRRSHGRVASALPALLLHAVAIAIVAVAASRGLAPSIGIGLFILLAVRAAVGLTPAAVGAPARKVGFMEIGWGIATILVLGIGMQLGL